MIHIENKRHIEKKKKIRLQEKLTISNQQFLVRKIPEKTF